MSEADTTAIRTWLRVAIPDNAMDVDYYGAEQMRDALVAVLDACKQLDDRARAVSCVESYNEGWVDGVYEVTTEIEDALADALGVQREGTP